jgi:DNA-binding transcriptional MerR regulator
MARPVNRKTMFAGLAAAGVLSAGIAVPALAFASEPSPAPTGSASTSASSSATGSPSTAADQHEAAFAAALAKELGVPQDKVTAALQKLRDQRTADHKTQQGDNKADRQAQLKQRLDQAVKAGKLTQEQADAINKAVQAGVLPGAGWLGHDRAGWQGKGGNWQGHRAGGWSGKAADGKWQDRDGGRQGEAGEHRQRGGEAGDKAGFVSTLAKELGVPQDKLTAALQKVREQRKEADKPKPPANQADRQAQLKQRLDQAVKDGKLTQAESDAITKVFTDHGFGGPGK